MLTLLTSTALISTLQGETCDNRGLYVGGFGGVNFLQAPKDNTGITGGLAVGYKSDYDIRIELEGACRYNNIRLDNTEYRNLTYSVMLNMYYDFDLGYVWIPYIGVGAGYSYTHIKEKIHFLNFFHYVGYGGGFPSNQSLHSFAYQGIVGVEREAWENAHVGIEYRCFFNRKDLRDQSALVTFKRYF